MEENKVDGATEEADTDVSSDRTTDVTRNAYIPKVKRLLSNKKIVSLITALVIILIIVIVVAIVLIKHKIWCDKQIIIAEKKCDEYLKFACDHQNKPPSNMSVAIVLGDNAPIGMFPHMAFIDIWDETFEANLATCGGSLISENFVLSAAHCVYNLGKYKLQIKLGSVTTSFADTTGEWFGSSETHIHPSYDKETGKNDLFLIKLDRTVKFSNNIRPICLNTKYHGQYDRAIASGWGRTENANFSIRLKMAELHIIEWKRCCELLEELCDSNFICTEFPGYAKSPHQGDSGGPLQVKLKNCSNTYEEIGVINAVENKGEIKTDSPLVSIHIKVETFVPWIASIVWSNEP